MPTQDKWSQFIAQLIERTQDDRVKWSSYKPKEVEGSRSKIEQVYQTKYEDKALRLFKVEPKGESQPRIAGWWSQSSEREQIILKVVDEQQGELWRFPETPALGDLLSAVKYQVARIDEFLKAILEQ